jgi:hypothetical protein
VSLQRLKVYRWDEIRARGRAQLDVMRDTDVELPADHDKARAEIKRRIPREIKNSRIRSLSAITGGGFAVVVEITRKG